MVFPTSFNHCFAQAAMWWKFAMKVATARPAGSKPDLRLTMSSFQRLIELIDVLRLMLDVLQYLKQVGFDQ